MKHLTAPGDWRWCDPGTADEGYDRCYDPLKADCPGCLRAAATYGAKAAMRCAAVEAGGSSDEELVAERDEAVQALEALRRKVADSGFFVCQGCDRLLALAGTGFIVGTMRWCAMCAGGRGRIL